MQTKLCKNCGQPGPWTRQLEADVFQEVKGIDGDRDLHVETTDTQLKEGHSFQCQNCGYTYPGPFWWQLDNTSL